MPAVDVPDSYYDLNTFIDECVVKPGLQPGDMIPVKNVDTFVVQSTNPKDCIGIKKPPIHLVPPVAIIHEAMAFKDGAEKYGPYNWRGESVLASVYMAACYRHLMAWFDGESLAQDSKAHHLGHARACLAIILDAASVGKLVDDRPSAGFSATLLSLLATSEKGKK